MEEIPLPVAALTPIDTPPRREGHGQPASPRASMTASLANCRPAGRSCKGCGGSMHKRRPQRHAGDHGAGRRPRQGAPTRCATPAASPSRSSATAPRRPAATRLRPALLACPCCCLREWLVPPHPATRPSWRRSRDWPPHSPCRSTRRRTATSVAAVATAPPRPWRRSRLLRARGCRSPSDQARRRPLRRRSSAIHQRREPQAGDRQRSAAHLRGAAGRPRHGRRENPADQARGG